MPDQPQIEIGEAPAYVSYSAYTQWVRCGKAFQLSRLLDVLELPAWYFVGGTAFHKAVEDYDRELVEEGRG